MSITRNRKSVNDNAFPTRQLFILALCRICEPIAFMSIFPYIYFMVKSFKITEDERKLAMYAGMVTSAFALAEFLASIFWGRLSDRVGRKPILLTGMAGTGISMVIFGFSPSLPVALFARALGGILNGNIGVLQTTVSEVVKCKKHQPRAFSLMPFVWCIGAIIGSVVGGTLAEPVKNYPTIFTQGGVFDKFPYLLPNLVCVVVVVAGLITGFLFLEESHEDKKDRPDFGLELGNRIIQFVSLKWVGKVHEIPEEEDLWTEKLALNSDVSDPRFSVNSNGEIEIPIKPTKTTYTWREMFSNQVLLLVLSLGLLAFHTIAFEQLLPVLFSMPESQTSPQLPFKFLGGFSLTTKAIGVILAVQGVLQMIAQIFVFPAVVARIGPLWTFRITVFTYPVLYCIVPYLTLVPHNFRYVAVVFVLVWKVTNQAMSYPSIAMMFLAETPSKKVLGTLNGVGQSAACLARTIGPIMAGSIQAEGLRAGYSGFSWWFCAFIACLGIWTTSYQKVKQQRPDPTDGGAIDEESSLSTYRPVPQQEFLDQPISSRTSHEGSD